MKIEDAYTQWSTTYDSDRNLTRDLDQHITKHAFGGRRYQQVLELGCGTGKNTALFSCIGRQVLAFDLSVGMLRQAKEKIRSDNVLFATADITKPWPCRSQSFELIVCNLVLEHIQNLAAIFSQASQALTTGGQVFVSELHPYRQYQGTKANFRRNQESTVIDAFVHHISDFTEAAGKAGLTLQRIEEWWHEQDDQNGPPRLISFEFEKPNS